MMVQFKDSAQGIVGAGGTLVLRFGPPYNNKWQVQQVSLEMGTAPAGCTAEVRAMGSLVSPAPSARKASASGEPFIPLEGGETMTVQWSGATPGEVGRIWYIYEKTQY